MLFFQLRFWVILKYTLHNKESMWNYRFQAFDLAPIKELLKRYVQATKVESNTIHRPIITCTHPTRLLKPTVFDVLNGTSIVSCEFSFILMDECCSSPLWGPGSWPLGTTQIFFLLLIALEITTHPNLSSCILTATNKAHSYNMSTLPVPAMALPHPFSTHIQIPPF